MIPDHRGGVAHLVFRYHGTSSVGRYTIAREIRELARGRIPYGAAEALVSFEPLLVARSHR
jgi:hypothetical protein